MNLINCTIKMKEEARAHYTRLAEAVGEKETKRIFSLLASAEEEHLRMLREMKSHAEFVSADRWGMEDSVCAYRPNIDAANVRESLRDDPDAYRHVTAEEKEAIRFFEMMADRTNDKAMKGLCRVLADEERKHLEKIENIYSFVEDPRTYLEWREFSNRVPL